MAQQKNEMGLRRVPLPFLIAGLSLSLLIGYYAGAAAVAGADILEWYSRLEDILADPLKLYWNGRYSLVGTGLAAAAYLLGILYYMTSGRNYMIGKEYGNARYADNQKVNGRLAEKLDPKDSQNTESITIKKRFGTQKAYINMKNRQLTQHIQMSLNTRHTDLNNNILVIGGSGAGKTFRFVGPNLMQMSSSFICTDPKGEITRKYGGFLEKHGYEIKVVNLLNADGMKKSTRYNPFRYIRTDTDIVKLVTNFFENTKKKGAQSGDQFWDDMAGLLLQAFFYYTRDVGVEVDGVVRHDFKGVMKLVNLAKIEENPQTGARQESELDRMFMELEQTNPDSLAVISYNKAMVGAADTVRSIISTLNSRTTSLQTAEILDLLSNDEIDIPAIGTRKTALFCIIPDNDKTYNFLIGMLYSQIFQELYYQADFIYGGSLPVHVTFMLDEFSNVALPDGFTSLLSTMRSRNISSIIIIQNLAQIKELFEKSWETIPGNCDTTIYLGGNEQETHKYISEMLGKQTIDKKSTGETKGKQGSSSSNYDVLGRELMLPDEVRKLDGKKCLVFIRGFNPILDDKIHTNELPFWKEVCRIEKTFRFDARLKRAAQTSHSSRLHFYSEEELRGTYADERREEEEYQALCQLAKLGQIEEKPVRPAKKILEVTFGELLQSYLQAGEVFDDGLLRKNREIYQKEQENMRTEREGDGVMEKEEPDQQEQGRWFYERLLQYGYDEEQVLSLRSLTGVLTPEEVREQFPKESIPDILWLLAEDYLNELDRKIP